MIPTKIDIRLAGSTPAAGTNNYGRKFRAFCRFCYIYRTFQTKCSGTFGRYWKKCPIIANKFAMNFAMKFATRPTRYNVLANDFNASTACALSRSATLM